MPELEIYRSNLRRHKKKNKQTNKSNAGQLRSFKRPGYLEVRRKKCRFFLATNLGWRSANAIIIIIIIIIIMLSIKGPILTSFTCIFLGRWPTAGP